MEENQSHQLENIYKAYCAKGEARRDLISLLALTQESPNNETKEERDHRQQAIDLFWNFYYPSFFSLPGWEINRASPDLTESERQVVLDTLENLEKSSRVPYKPDTDVPLDELFVYLHIAACRALMLKKRDSYSEEVRMVLDEAWRASRWFEGLEGIPYCYRADDDLTSEHTRSFVAVTGIVALELATALRLEGNYEESFHLFAVGLSYVSSVALAAYNEEDPLHLPHPKDKYIPKIDMAAQMFVDSFEYLRSPAITKNWRQIARDCFIISACWKNCFLFGNTRDETVIDNEGWEWDPPEFWQQAKGWAEAKLEPSELLEEMKKAEDEKAEQRLTTYFFEKRSFNAFPERAKQSLIEAEKAWFSTKSGRADRIFNELRIATEEVLYCSFWKPLSEWMDTRRITDPRLLDFQRIRESISEANKQPSLVEFESMLKSFALREFLKPLTLSDVDSKFVLDELPKALKQLRSYRRSAEHDLQRVREPKEIASIFKEFLGIGYKGILPRLLEVQKVITSSREKAS